MTQNPDHLPFGDVTYFGENTQQPGGVRVPREESLRDERTAPHTIGQLSLFGAAAGFAVEPGVDRRFDPWGGVTYTHDQPPFVPRTEATD